MKKQISHNKNKKHKPVTENSEQNEMPTKKSLKKDIKHQPPIENKVTKTTKNTASQEPGLNQDKTIHNDLEPGIY